MKQTSPRERPNVRTLPDGKEIVWFSQADDWAHLYLLDGEGKTKNRITQGEWVSASCSMSIRRRAH